MKRQCCCRVAHFVEERSVFVVLPLRSDLWQTDGQTNRPQHISRRALIPEDCCRRRFVKNRRPRLRKRLEMTYFRQIWSVRKWRRSRKWRTRVTTFGEIHFSGGCHLQFLLQAISPKLSNISGRNFAFKLKWQFSALRLFMKAILNERWI